MKWILLIVVNLWVAVILMDMASGPVQAERVATERLHSAEQRDLLVELQHVGTPDAARLAAEWAEAYPQPTSESLTELRLVVDRVKTDPTTAADFTVEAKRERRKGLEDKFTPAVGWSEYDPKPGL